jgi:SAM-dependent methyltransferase
MASDGVDELLGEQQAYYRARAGQYDQEYAANADVLGPDRILPELPIEGDVLELACGTGQWTLRLAGRATSLTAVDGAPEMLAVAARRTAGRAVDYRRVDLFEWRPDRRYDRVFFGFWLSHVPPERYPAFWSMVAGALRPGGLAVFVDDSAASTGHEEWLPDLPAPAATRRLDDGTPHRIVKVPLDPARLAGDLGALGWTATIREIDGGLLTGVATPPEVSAAR